MIDCVGFIQDEDVQGERCAFLMEDRKCSFMYANINTGPRWICEHSKEMEVKEK